MRITGYDSSSYTRQAQLPTVPDVETKKNTDTPVQKETQENRQTDLAQAGVVVTISSQQQTESNQKQEPKVKLDILEQIGEQAAKDWKRLCNWVKQMLAQGKELVEKVRLFIKSLTEETEDMTDKVGNPGLAEEKRAETGVAPLTWQESFKQRVKVFFDAVAGFLAKNLPMNHGGYFGTKEEKREEELAEKGGREGKRRQNSRENNSDTPGSTFDQRG